MHPKHIPVYYFVYRQAEPAPLPNSWITTRPERRGHTIKYKTYNSLQELQGQSKCQKGEPNRELKLSPRTKTKPETLNNKHRHSPFRVRGWARKLFQNCLCERARPTCDCSVDVAHMNRLRHLAAGNSTESD